MRLDELRPPMDAVVVGLDAVGAERRRLMDLGILPGCTVRAERVSPLGDPTAYVVRGGLVALRRAQAEKVVVGLRTPESGGPSGEC
jgi:Fe2+ transport system protein FeoA